VRRELRWLRTSDLRIYVLSYLRVDRLFRGWVAWPDVSAPLYASEQNRYPVVAIAGLQLGTAPVLAGDDPRHSDDPQEQAMAMSATPVLVA
jgi:hypothetical protein